MRGSAESVRLRAVRRWLASPCSQDELELHFYRIQRAFRIYRPNLYILNRAALRIQHWFFRRACKDGPRCGGQATRVKSPECSDVKITENSLSQPLFPSTHEDDIVSIPSVDASPPHMRLQTTQEMSFMSHSHITSEERYTRSLRHSVMQNSGFRVNKDHSNSNTAHARNITPHGVSSRGGRNFLKADLTPVTLKSPGTAQQHKSPLASPKPPLHPEPSELEEFLKARRCEIQKKEAEFLKTKQQQQFSGAGAETTPTKMKLLDFSQNEGDVSIAKSAYSQRSHTAISGGGGGGSQGPVRKQHRDESYTDTGGRVHHPKKWGANQHNWKAHDIESLSHLIEEAWKNKLESARRKAKLARAGTPISQRSEGGGSCCGGGGIADQAQQKPRFVTNCDWVGGGAQSREQSKSPVREADMGEYFNKEREERAHSRNRSAVRTPVLNQVEEEEEKAGVKVTQQSPLEGQQQELELELEKEEKEEEEVPPLPPRKKSSNNFSKKYARQTSWRVGEVEAIEGLVERAARHHKSQSTLQRPFTPSGGGGTTTTKISLKGVPPLISPGTDRSPNAVKYELKPIELRTGAAGAQRTPASLRQRMSVSSAKNSATVEAGKVSNFFSTRDGSRTRMSRKYSKVESKVKLMLQSGAGGAAGAGGERSATPNKRSFLKAHSRGQRRASGSENKESLNFKKELQRLDSEYEQNRSSKDEEWIQTALRVPFQQVL